MHAYELAAMIAIPALTVAGFAWRAGKVVWGVSAGITRLETAVEGNAKLLDNHLNHAYKSTEEKIDAIGERVAFIEGAMKGEKEKL